MARLPSRRPSERGFTLLEVLVAVAILGIAMAAIIKSVSENTANAAYLREKTFAHWVAVNKLAELRVTEAWETGRSSGKSQMVEREWPWQVEISETPNSEIRRVDIAVFSPQNPEAQLASLTSMLGDPKMRAAPQGQSGGGQPGAGQPGGGSANPPGAAGPGQSLRPPGEEDA